MITLAIDIGGTKFALAMFEDQRIIQRAGGITDRAGGPHSMLDRIGAICADWKARYNIARCGIGFGGPVDFLAQRVVQSTHVPGWDNFDLPREIEKLAGVRPSMDNDANLGALGEAVYGAGRGYRPLFYMTLSTGIGGGLIPEAETRLPRRGFLRRRNRASHHPAGRARVPVRSARVPGANVLRPVAGARSRASGA